MLSQPVPGSYEVPQVDMTALYLEALGGMSKKKRVFDTGSRSYFYSGDDSSSTSVLSGATSQPAFTEEAFTQRVDEMRAQIRDEVRTELREEVRTKMQQMQARMQAQMEAHWAQIFSRFSQPPQFPPPHPL
ncbi:hypothetical protein C2S52_001426 [Perilla frutescens var. hirtella]|nr:hypothetical protein C2S52_001426 [Perilla frutescens var. hirtella]